ncbi:hypothetical protein J6590_061052 [Homalodisca vitripennis]|nr:hypothetical protein J6590_061052 [Homalodisca vitripennis]
MESQHSGVVEVAYNRLWAPRHSRELGPSLHSGVVELAYNRLWAPRHSRELGPSLVQVLQYNAGLEVRTPRMLGCLMDYGITAQRCSGACIQPVVGAPSLERAGAFPSTSVTV